MRYPTYEKALAFAMEAHKGISRKYTGEPYWHHLARVAAAVISVPGSTDAMVAAALLHDTVEDTAVTEADLYREFGFVIASYVHLLTDIKSPGVNRASRKAATVARLLNAPNEVKTIKLADILDNAPSIIEYDPDFAPVFLKEKKALLGSLKGGDPDLYAKAASLFDADECTK